MIRSCLPRHSCGGSRTRCDARLLDHRVHSESVLPSVLRCSVHGPAGRRCPPTQGHHRAAAGQLGLPEDNHQLGQPSRREIQHGGGGVDTDQRSAVPTIGRRRRQRERDLEEQEDRHVCYAPTRGILRSAVHQDARVAVQERL